MAQGGKDHAKMLQQQKKAAEKEEKRLAKLREEGKVHPEAQDRPEPRPGE